MTSRTDLENFGKFYEKEIEWWIANDLLDEDKYKAAYKKNIVDNGVTPAKFYREIFRAGVLGNFYCFTHSISDVVERNPKYRTYIERIDYENNHIHQLDRKITAIKRGHGNEKDLPKLIEERDDWLLKRPPVTLVEIPRGLLKSTIFQTHRGAWYYLVGAVLTNQAPVIFVLHEDKNKAADNLGLIKKVFDIDYIKHAFSDVLNPKRDRIDELAFADKSDVMRKESHFMSQSIHKDLGGKHGAIFLVDDMELRDNSRSVEQKDRLIEIFLSWEFLDDHLGRMRMEMAGTPYYEDGVYQLIEERGEQSVVWREGATVDKDGNPTLLLGKEKCQLNFPEIYDYDKCLKMYNRFGKRADMYYSQVEMISQPRVDLVEIVSGINYLFDDEEVTIQTLINKGCVVVSKDPSYSTANKRKGDGKSRDVTITGSIYNGCFYVFDSEQLLGGESGKLFEPLQRQFINHKADIVIQDSQGTQINYARLFHKQLMSIADHRFQFIYYKKPKQNNTVGKAQRASLTLSEYFRMGMIRVHRRMRDMIAELERQTKGFDYLDTLLMVTSIDFDLAENYARGNRIEQETKEAVRKQQKQRRKSRNIVNRTTGY